MCVWQDAGQGHLVAKLFKNIGWSLGTELREMHYGLTAKNATLIKPGMIFNLSIGARLLFTLALLRPGKGT